VTIRWQMYRFSVIAPQHADDRWCVHDALGQHAIQKTTAADAMQRFTRIANDLRTIDKRKYVTLWVRDADAAASHRVGRVLWAGDNEGPGLDARKAGRYSIDRLIEVVHFHIGMMS
jgi:hypothetical protein